MIHAPSCAFVAATTRSTMPVTSAPTPFTSALVAQPGPRRRHQWTTMPACDSVKDTNTPIMYRGISACVSPRKTISRIAAKMLSPTMPFEKARRSPWFMNWRGTYRSRARIDASRGKSA